MESNIIVLLISLGFIYESLSCFFRLRSAEKWILKERTVTVHDYKIKSRIYIFIPVLKETAIIRKTADYFYENFVARNPNVRVVFITTEKERVSGVARPDTIDMAAELAIERLRILHLHFPNTNGKMAHQLNYAVKYLSDSATPLCDDDLIAVYNADSRPEPETLSWVDHLFAKGKARAFQQYGCYTGNLNSLHRSKYSSVLVSAALWQTRWAIGFEIFNALKQLDFVGTRKRLSMNYPFNYCIGHGLFLSVALIREIDQFNEETHNEDAILGLKLCDRQELLMPIPYFDVSESPDTIGMLYRQKANWYFGPLQAYRYATHIHCYAKRGMVSAMRLYVLTTKLFLHAVYWIAGPTAIAVALLVSLLDLNFSLIFLSAGSLAIFAFPNVIAYSQIRSWGLYTQDSCAKLLRSVTFGFFCCYMLHGASAYKGVAKYVLQVATGRNASKEKTVMKRV